MTTPLGTLVRGLAAGAAGTLTMDLVWFARYKRGGGQQSFFDWEFSVGLDDWSKASAPGQLGKRIYEALFRRELSARYAALTNNIMHWSYGVGWGGLYGILAGSRPHLLSGLPFGAFVWGTSYVVLPPTGLYKPIWEYDLSTLWQDLSAHLAYGMGTSTTFGVLSRGRER
ncbi:MAG TPA: hypothetical protein VGE94_06500 [Chloroflexota bacterium]